MPDPGPAPARFGGGGRHLSGGRGPGGDRPGHRHRGEPVPEGDPGGIYGHGRQGHPRRGRGGPGGGLPLPGRPPEPLGQRLCGSGGKPGAGHRLQRRHLPPRRGDEAGRGGGDGPGPAGLQPERLLRGLPHRTAVHVPQPEAGPGGQRLRRRRPPHPAGRGLSVLQPALRPDQGGGALHPAAGPQPGRFGQAQPCLPDQRGDGGPGGGPAGLAVAAALHPRQGVPQRQPGCRLRRPGLRRNLLEFLHEHGVGLCQEGHRGHPGHRARPGQPHLCDGGGPDL